MNGRIDSPPETKKQTPPRPQRPAPPASHLMNNSFAAPTDQSTEPSADDPTLSTNSNDKGAARPRLSRRSTARDHLLGDDQMTNSSFAMNFSQQIDLSDDDSLDNIPVTVASPTNPWADQEAVPTENPSSNWTAAFQTTYDQPQQPAVHPPSPMVPRPRASRPLTPVNSAISLEPPPPAASSRSTVIPPPVPPPPGLSPAAKLNDTQQWKKAKQNSEILLLQQVLDEGDSGESFPVLPTSQRLNPFVRNSACASPELQSTWDSTGTGTTGIVHNKKISLQMANCSTSSEPAQLVKPSNTVKTMPRARTPEIWEEELLNESDLEPLEPYYDSFNDDGWEFGVRIPIGRKPTFGQRSWKTIFVRLRVDPNATFLLLFDNNVATKPFHEILITPQHSVSKIERQDFDEFGKVYVVKISITSYTERPWLRPDKIIPKGVGYTSIKDLTKLVTNPRTTSIIDHTPTETELIKIGSLDGNTMRVFVHTLEDALMRLHVERRITEKSQYAKDELLCDVIDEYEAQIGKNGHIDWHKARVRVFFLAFLSAVSPVCELGLNDKRRRGKEVVGRNDIIPLRFGEEWIRVEHQQCHAIVDEEVLRDEHVLRFVPLDAARFELCRFRVRPRANLELPLQIGCRVYQYDCRVEVRIEAIISGYFSASRRAAQSPCENIEIRFPVPDPWVYLFKYEKYGFRSIKSVTRKPGKIIGFERLSQLASGFLQPSLLEVDTGQAKYENLTKSVTWRIDRLPERGHGAYKSHMCCIHLTLQEHDKVPDSFEQYLEVDYHMPSTAISKTAVRSISVEDLEPPDKWVKYNARFRYKVEIDYISGPPEGNNTPDYSYNSVEREQTPPTTVGGSVLLSGILNSLSPSGSTSPQLDDPNYPSDTSSEGTGESEGDKADSLPSKPMFEIQQLTK